MERRIVIACRHGANYGDSLSKEGIQQSNDLAVAINNLIGPETNIRIFTSEEVRAKETAAIIATMINAKYETLRILSCDTHECGMNAAEEIIPLTASNAVVIAVTHSRAPRGIIVGFRQAFGLLVASRSGEIDKGTGLLLSLSGQTSKIP